MILCILNERIRSVDGVVTLVKMHGAEFVQIALGFIGRIGRKQNCLTV